MDAVRRVRERLDVRVPLIGAPMAYISGGALAAAVSGAGGLGFIGAGYADRGWLDAQLDLATARGAPVGVGLITWTLDGEVGAVEHVLRRGVRHLWLSFGDPRPYLPVIHEAGAVAVCQVQTLDEACAAAAAGADVVVAQGCEAGGHGRHEIPLRALLRDVVPAVHPTPVLAAGGIARPEQVASALALGAGGAVLGTRLYATREALDTAEAKDQLVRCTGDRTSRTKVFDLLRGPRWPEQYTGRAIINETVTRWAGREAELLEQLPAERQRYEDAVRRQDLRHRVVWAGTGLDDVHDVPAAADVMARVGRGFSTG